MADLIETPVKRRYALELANALRAARTVGDRVSVPTAIPLIGGIGLGQLLLGQAPESAERLGYGERMTSGKGQTLRIRPETMDLALAMPVNAALKGGASVVGGVNKVRLYHGGSTPSLTEVPKGDLLMVFLVALQKLLLYRMDLDKIILQIFQTKKYLVIIN